ncbi:hypothetical protein H632_c819p1 [Helicosporidium sp. ATCC 50920]|nr:hypothetical protein H632_c819p1 [Helicosporidium sp. ATCC 50920]|eukprot:KDD75188.1 hypothetical protein H632_c819p1 [Helicosporidium sp. ATCC 50920]
MSTKEEKPQLAYVAVHSCNLQAVSAGIGVRLKTRKRNIVVPHDPQSFADAVIEVLSDARESDDVDKTLDAANKVINEFWVLDGAELDFSRYGEVLFEVAFAGARLTTGANVSVEGKQLSWHILASPPEPSAIIPFVRWFQTMIRRRPFLVKHLENTLVKLLLSMEFYDDLGRTKIAIALSRVLSMKVGVLPDRVLPPMLNDRLVQRGTVLQFATELFRDLIASDGVETLLEILRKARLEQRLLDFFPPHKRTWKEFDDHFHAAGLDQLVEHNKKKLYDVHCQELRQIVSEAVGGEEPASPEAVGQLGKARAAEWGISDAESARAVLLGLVDTVLESGGSRNQQQIVQGVRRTLRTYAPALRELCPTPRVEASLLVAAQVACYEDSRLLKLFTDMVRILYDADVLGEQAIRYWYQKGPPLKGRNVFLQDMQPFIQWLDEAEEEDSDDE